MTPTNRNIRNLAIGGWLIALVAVLLCGTYYVRAWIELGYWPTYGNPDSKDLDWPYHHLLVLLGVLSIYPALLLSSACSILLLCRQSYRSGAAILAATVTIFIGLQLLTRTPPFDEFFAWYID